MGNDLEYKLKHYIRTHDWDIDYNGSTVKNYWGTKWKVRIEDSEGCMEMPGIAYPDRKEIVLREPCDLHINVSLYDSKEEDLAYTLAHELGHADTWGISTILPYLILGTGIASSVKSKSGKPLVGAVAGVAACKIVLDELLAETAATVLHDAPFLKGLYLCLPDFADMYDQLTHMF